MFRKARFINQKLIQFEICCSRLVTGSLYSARAVLDQSLLRGLGKIGRYFAGTDFAGFLARFWSVVWCEFCD